MEIALPRPQTQVAGVVSQQLSLRHLLGGIWKLYDITIHVTWK